MLKTRKRKLSSIQTKESFADLHNQGYQIIDINGKHQLTNQLYQVLDKISCGARKIFNSPKNDKKRSQVELPKNVLDEKYLQQISKQLSQLFPQHTQNNWNLLKSMPGCQTQMAHTDYVPNYQLATVPDHLVPLSVIIPLENDTPLRVWPSSHRYSTIDPVFIPPKKISYLDLKLQIGQILIFRGDLVHAGSAFSKKNLRIHLYLDSPVVSRFANRTWIIRHQYPEIADKIVE